MTVRTAALVGLVSAAFWSALPWLGCGFNPVTKMIDVNFLRFCTFGPGFPFPPTGFGVPGFVGPYWGNLIVAVAYLIAAVVLAVKTRSS
jgi:hypothetical protein